ncbi:hypothetical protein COMA2_190096 [Candidatus Nitrospira nitrificans]|uniref:Uncharacterized protein n=1 Tax=Candidatus Nitrospira nitrificans TaxID=1742973 RepID=A0A0S4LDW1_9BACT|nr:hypothetical protein COMA2_190096 [Candidatus Nitrospira nitrificans]
MSCMSPMCWGPSTDRDPISVLWQVIQKDVCSPPTPARRSRGPRRALHRIRRRRRENEAGGFPNRLLGAKRALGQDRVDVDELFRSVDRVENPPFPHGILAESRKVVCNGFMAQVVDIGCQPLGLVEQPLGHGFVNRGEILCDAGLKGEAVPGHGILPPEAEPLGYVFSGEPVAVRQ